MTGARADGWQRRARKVAVRTVRRSGLLPSTIPDRLGDDDRLEGASLDATVLVYFPDTRESLYQLRPWYDPLRALDARHRVVLVFQDSRTAAVVRAELGLPVLTIARYGALDGLLSRSKVKLFLYVNHTPQNFSALRFTSVAHVYLTHGDSDKGVSVSNQAKAYDFCFVAGQAAIDRMAHKLMFTDPEQWCIPVGRPTLDGRLEVAMPLSAGPRPDRVRVLYAPTWEGAQPSVSYGSVASHGPALVEALLAAPGVVVHYRPHPLTGVTDATYGTADARIRSLIAAASEAEPGRGHSVDVAGTVEGSFSQADVLVCDVSAVAMDWLPTGRPLVVTTPHHPGATVAGTRLLEVVPRLSVADLPRAADIVLAAVRSDDRREERLALVDYYLGDVAPGASTQRFLEACDDVIRRRDEQWSAITADGPAGP